MAFVKSLLPEMSFNCSSDHSACASSLGLAMRTALRWPGGLPAMARSISNSAPILSSASLAIGRAVGFVDVEEFAAHVGRTRHFGPAGQGQSPGSLPRRRTSIGALRASDRDRRPGDHQDRLDGRRWNRNFAAVRHRERTGERRTCSCASRLGAAACASMHRKTWARTRPARRW